VTDWCVLKGGCVWGYNQLQLHPCDPKHNFKTQRNPAGYPLDTFQGQLQKQLTTLPHPSPFTVSGCVLKGGCVWGYNQLQLHPCDPKHNFKTQRNPCRLPSRHFSGPTVKSSAREGSNCKKTYHYSVWSYNQLQPHPCDPKHTFKTLHNPAGYPLDTFQGQRLRVALRWETTKVKLRTREQTLRRFFLRGGFFKGGFF
jgi:hypothetical protein